MVIGATNSAAEPLHAAYAQSLYMDVYGSTLDGLHESVTTLEDLERIARRVLGNAHPLIEGIEMALRGARRAREAYVRAA